MEGFNDIWANILNDDLLNAKDLHNVPVLEPPSEIHNKMNLNLDSRLYESSMDNLVPSFVENKEKNNQIVNIKKTVKEDKITYSMNQQSKDSIMLPNLFTKEHLDDIMQGGRDLMSPISSKNKLKGKNQQFDEDISEISKGNNMFSSGIISNTQSLLMEDITKGEGAFFSELN